MEGHIDSRSHPGKQCKITQKPLFYSMKAGCMKQLGVGGSKDSCSMGVGGVGLGGVITLSRDWSHTRHFFRCVIKLEIIT